MSDWDKPPYIIIQKQFWACPVQVITGMHFAMIGFLLGFLFAAWIFIPSSEKDLPPPSESDTKGTATEGDTSWQTGSPSITTEPVATH